MTSDILVVGHQDHRDALFLIELLEKRDDFATRLAVEIAGGLVPHQDRRLVDQGAGDGDALLLPARELAGMMIEPFLQTDSAQLFESPFVSFFGGDAKNDTKRALNSCAESVFKNGSIIIRVNSQAANGSVRRLPWYMAVPSLMADEPTGNLDARSRGEFDFRKLNEEQGITVILVTHDQDVAGNAARTMRACATVRSSTTRQILQAIQSLHAHETGAYS